VIDNNDFAKSNFSLVIYAHMPLLSLCLQFSCVLDDLTTMNKFSAPRIIRYSMLKHEKQIY